MWLGRSRPVRESAPVVLPKGNEEGRQDPMEKDRNHSPEPAGFWIETHADNVAEDHGGQIDIAKPKHAMPKQGLGLNEVALPTGKVPTDYCAARQERLPRIGQVRGNRRRAGASTTTKPIGVAGSS